jgi:hypothetical protein
VPIAEAGRSHWVVENGLHWVLDMAFREDDNGPRAGHSAENLALVRKVALTFIQQDWTRKAGVKASRLRAGWAPATSSISSAHPENAIVLQSALSSRLCPIRGTLHSSKRK